VRVRGWGCGSLIAIDLINVLRHPSPAWPIFPITTSQHAQLLKLADIVHHHTQVPPSITPSPSPSEVQGQRALQCSTTPHSPSPTLLRVMKSLTTAPSIPQTSPITVASLGGTQCTTTQRSNNGYDYTVTLESINDLSLLSSKLKEKHHHEYHQIGSGRSWLHRLSCHT
jgi:hypothetical protein